MYPKAKTVQQRRASVAVMFNTKPILDFRKNSLPDSNCMKNDASISEKFSDDLTIKEGWTFNKCLISCEKWYISYQSIIGDSIINAFLGCNQFFIRWFEQSITYFITTYRDPCNACCAHRPGARCEFLDILRFWCGAVRLFHISCGAWCYNFKFFGSGTNRFWCVDPWQHIPKI